MGEGCWWLAMSATGREEGESGSKDDYVNALYKAAGSGSSSSSTRTITKRLLGSVTAMMQSVGMQRSVPWLRRPGGTAGEASRVRHRQSRRTTEGCRAAGQSGTASASRVSARETVQQCSGDGQWAALRWTDARRMRMLSVAEGA